MPGLFDYINGDSAEFQKVDSRSPDASGVTEEKKRRSAAIVWLSMTFEEFWNDMPSDEKEYWIQLLANATNEVTLRRLMSMIEDRVARMRRDRVSPALVPPPPRHSF